MSVLIKGADLHTHSDRSDGMCPPADVVRRAHRRSVRVLALTDHDTISGNAEAKAEALRLGIRFAGGIEVNTQEGQVHILGYGIDGGSGKLKRWLAAVRARRRRRVGRILARLRRLGIELGPEELGAGPEMPVGRPHVADALRRKGVVRTRSEAFRKYLSKGAPAYEPSMGPLVEEAISAIRKTGGWACLAHPGLLGKSLDIAPWVDQGLEGIEAFYPGHTQAQTGRFVEMAKRFGLLVTGGSDYHGPGTSRVEIGSVPIPEEHLRRVEGRLGLCS
ncbi:MAG: PHP domain-containing protein [Elusimicrobiota bacterium]